MIPNHGDMNINVNETPNIEMSVNEQKKKGSNLQVDVKPAPIELPDSHDLKGNTLKCLEDELLKRSGFDPGMDVEERNKILKSELFPKVVNFHGKLPKTDPLKADSPIEFETYELKIPKRNDKGEVIMDPITKQPEIFMTCKALKVKMLWQMEVKLPNGKTEVVEFEQYVKTPCVLPDDLSKTEVLNHAKHMALLYTKIHRKLHKKALLGNYELNSHKPIDTDHLIKNLRTSSRFGVTHFPNPGHFSQNLSRGLRGEWRMRASDGAAQYSDIELGGKKIFLGYSSDFDFKGRKLMEFKPGDQLPKGGGKAQFAMTKYVKVDVPNSTYYNWHVPPIDRVIVPDDQARLYSDHLYSQGQACVIKDEKLENFEKTGKLTSQNISQEVQNKGIDRNEFCKYQKSIFDEEVEKFDREEHQSRLHALSLWSPLSATGFTLTSILAEIPILNLATKPGHWINEKILTRTAAIRKLINGQTQIFDGLINMANQAQGQQKNLILQQLKQACNQVKDLKTQLKKLSDYHEGLKTKDDHLNQLNPGKEKIENRSRKRILDDVDKRMNVYQPLIDKLNEAEKLLV